MARECKDGREYHTLADPKQFATKSAFKEAVAFGVHWKCARCGLGSRPLTPDLLWKPGDTAVFTVPSFKWYARITRNVADTGFVIE